VTVHGEQALIPSGTTSDAAAALTRYARTYNKAARTFDAQTMGTVETGPLGTADQATLRAYRATRKGDNPGFKPVSLTDPHFYIPRQRGWPKWFVAVATYNHSDRTRWLLVFQRHTSREAWRASYMASVSKTAVPRFAVDGEGYAEPVAADASGLAVPPGSLSKAYSDYLEKGGKGSDVFADGFATSQLLADRQNASTADYRLQYADQPAPADEFPPVALRTQDGGALVFFATHHVERYVYRVGLTPDDIPAITQALTTGTVKESLTLGQIGRSTVIVPPKSAARRKVTFLNLFVNLVTAKGE
jgi:hypothetical protein